MMMIPATITRTMSPARPSEARPKTDAARRRAQLEIAEVEKSHAGEDRQQHEKQAVNAVHFLGWPKIRNLCFSSAQTMTTIATNQM